MNSLTGPELLTDAHLVDEFDCGENHLNTWLRKRARRNQADGSSRTWVVTHEGRIVGFYASSAAVLLRASATKRAARNQPDPLPALLLGRLGVDKQFHGRGLGAALLKHFLLKSIEIANVTGVQVLLVHAKDQRIANFYLRHGFEPSPIDDLTLMLLVKDLRR